MRRKPSNADFSSRVSTDSRRNSINNRRRLGDRTTREPAFEYFPHTGWVPVHAFSPTGVISRGLKNLIVATTPLAEETDNLKELSRIINVKIQNLA